MSDITVRRVLVVTSFFSPAYLAGGPVRTLDALVRGSEDPGLYWVMTSNSDLGRPGELDVSADQWVAWMGAHVWYQSDDNITAAFRALVAEARLRPDVVYLNSLWGVRYCLIYLLAKRIGVLRAEIILAPRGQLSSAALSIKPQKKKAFLKVVTSMGLLHGVRLQASSSIEAEDITRTLGPGVQILTSRDESLTRAADESALRQPEATPRVVYIGRLSEIKGVHLLLEALTLLEPTTRLDLDLYGEWDTSAYRQQCEQIAARSGGRVKVTFHGHVEHGVVPSLFAASDLFVLPTASENYCHVIGESLAAGCPVAVPDTTLWTSVIRDGGGVVLSDRSPDTIAALLDRRAGSSPSQRWDDKCQALATYRSWHASVAAERGLDTVLAHGG